MRIKLPQRRVQQEQHQERSGIPELLVLAILLATMSCSKDLPSPKPTDPDAADLRIMQFNILQATEETEGHEWYTVRRIPCIKMVKDIAPDIICLQEARKSQCTDLASELTGYNQIKHPKDDIESNGGQRNVIMYRADKFQLLQWDKFWFSEDGTASGDRFGDSKTTQKMTILAQMMNRKSRQVFWVYCTHFFASCENEASRSKCVEMSLESIKKKVPADKPVFFCGDLNLNYLNTDKQAILKPLFNYMSSAAISAKKGANPTLVTYNKWGASTNVLDYIFFRNATALNYNVIQNGTRYGTQYLSDHNAIWSDFRF